MIELVWRAHGRFAIGEESARETTVNVNHPTVIQEPGDGRALLELSRPPAGELLGSTDAGRVLTTVALAARGARVATSAAAVASAVETVLLSLPDPAVVRDVTLGEDG